MNLYLDKTNLTTILTKKVPYDDTIHKLYYPYGTAGFREYATELHPIMIRIGLAMALLSHHTMIMKMKMMMVSHQNNNTDTTTTPDTAPTVTTDATTTTATTNTTLPSIHFGIMITASHNTYEYNGVKCIYLDGGMIPIECETFITTIVNARNIDELLQYIQQQQLPSISVVESSTVSTTPQVPPPPPGSRYLPPTIHIGYDTRSHSVELANLVQEGIHLLSSSPQSTTTDSTTTTTTDTGCIMIQNHHIVTTPMLHHIVKHQNGIMGYYHHLPSIISTHPSINGYYHILVQAYQSLLYTKVKVNTNNNKKTNNTKERKVLHVDCACGVAYEHLKTIVSMLLPPNNNNHNDSNNVNHESSSISTIIIPHNPPSTTEPQTLNHQCGSEYVQKQQCSCVWYDSPTTTTTTMTTTTTTTNDDDDDDDTSNDRSYCASVDGDGDRIVFFSTSPSSSNDTNPFLLLDGDYIACLLCTFIQNEIQMLQSYVNNVTSSSSSSSQRPIPTPIRLGVVQTAYANGASTHYLMMNHIPVIMAKTGVKYVHAAAHDNYDIGIYFESNGHGTVIFNDAYYQYLYEMEQVLYPNASLHDTTQRPTPDVYCAYQRLKILPSLINQAVGDAISDLLLIDAILYIKEWTLQDWYTSLYTNLPSRQMKVKVLDRTIIQTNDNETQCISPPSVQPALNVLMEQHVTAQARIFIRPSGTEDVVRVYAEATTQEMADDLANQAIAIVQEFCGGI